MLCSCTALSIACRAQSSDNHVITVDTGKTKPSLQASHSHYRSEVLKGVRFDPLRTKCKPFDLKIQFVPRSRHFISIIKTNQLKFL
jgi:hypothetical protein